MGGPYLILNVRYYWAFVRLSVSNDFYLLQLSLNRLMLVTILFSWKKKKKQKTGIVILCIGELIRVKVFLNN